MRLLDPRFKYTPSLRTNILTTWKRHGFKPTTEAERAARQQRTQGDTRASAHSAPVLQLSSAKRKLRGWSLAARKTAGGERT